MTDRSMDEHTMHAAWAAFEKAIKFDEKRKSLVAEGKNDLAATAARASEKHFDRAVALEGAAFAEGALAA